MMKVECQICGKKLERITWSHLKLHDITHGKYKKLFPDSPILSDELSERMSTSLKKAYDTGKRKPVKLVGNDNPMKREEVRRKHKNSVQKKDRLEWRRRMSKSLKGRKVGGARPEKAKQISEKIKKYWNDPDSVFNSPEYIRKMEKGKRKRYAWKNDKGEKFASKAEKIFSEFLGDGGIDYKIRKSINLPEKYEKSWVIPDFYLPERNLVIEILGCWGSKRWSKEFDDVGKKEIYRGLGYDYLSVYPKDYKNLEKVFDEFDKEMSITEIYSTICGEGIELGRPAIFIRSSGCNLRCRGCDTGYAFRRGESMNLRDILFEIKKEQIFLNDKYKREKTNLVFLTGGEITIQNNLLDLVEMLKRHGFEILLQTNGTRFLEDVFELCDFISSDVKTPCFNEESNHEVLGKLIENYNEKLQLKFVIKDEEDINYALDISKSHPISDVKSVVFQPYNPEMSREKEISEYKKLVEKFLETPYEFNYSNIRVLPRIQILLWEKKKGV